ncbi:MAG: adenosine kinase [Leptospiraceae bacterium]|nr:adenosine kinase [Leptospiraceae bacterium]MCK6380327.1 adenosine kinase [Leptospiraceae bacterium]NUM41758.1 adenosine kinase [Leptospiraceae bacterium]
MKKYDVFGVGNALVDTLVNIDKKFLEDSNIVKGVMTLVDSEKQGELLASLHEHKLELRSGGSAANTMIALANSGGTGCYTGKVANDANGEFYKKDMENAGINFEMEPANTGHTGTCVVLMTPDADRTMLTHLGISITLTSGDIGIENLKKSKVSYIEGYLWDGEDTKNASLHAMDISKKNGVKVAFTYSDPFCVKRAKADFIQITKEKADYIFCNHDEAMSLSEKNDPKEALAYIGSLCQTAFMTWGKEGAYFVDKGIITHVPGFPVNPIDTNGAGDAFAAGVLYGITQGYSLAKACRWGNYVASRIIMEIGARLSVKLMGRQEEILVGY